MTTPPDPALVELARDFCVQLRNSGERFWPELITRFGAAVQRETWEADARIADEIARLYAERDDSSTGEPTAETCAAVAACVNVAAEIRARAVTADKERR